MDDHVHRQIQDLATHRREPGSSETEKAARAARDRVEARHTTAVDNAATALAGLGDRGGMTDAELARVALDAAGLPAILDALAAAETRADTANREAP